MQAVDFKTAFMYPFNRAKGMLNILWIFLPIVGWFALGGYSIRIIKEFIKGEFKELPKFNFVEDLEFGFFMFLKSLPFFILYMILYSLCYEINEGFGLLINFILALFVIPMLTINFFKKETIESYFEFKVIKPVFEHLGDYVVAFFKSVLLGIIFLFMSIILIGIPASAFSKNIFLADFYRRRV